MISFFNSPHNPDLGKLAWQHIWLYDINISVQELGLEAQRLRFLLLANTISHHLDCVLAMSSLPDLEVFDPQAGWLAVQSLSCTDGTCRVVCIR